MNEGANWLRTFVHGQLKFVSHKCSRPWFSESHRRFCIHFTHHFLHFSAYPFDLYTHVLCVAEKILTVIKLRGTQRPAERKQNEELAISWLATSNRKTHLTNSSASISRLPRADSNSSWWLSNMSNWKLIRYCMADSEHRSAWGMSSGLMIEYNELLPAQFRL